jgi:hypothetical protein
MRNSWWSGERGAEGENPAAAAEIARSLSNKRRRMFRGTGVYIRGSFSIPLGEPVEGPDVGG